MPRRIRFGRRTVLAAAVMLLSGALMYTSARSAPPEDQKKTNQQDERKKPVKPELPAKPQSNPPQKDYKIGVNVDMVVVHTTVADKNGQFVGGLKKEDFRLFEDNVGQSIASFSQEDVPVSLGIVIDISGSMRDKFDNVIKAALAFMRASNPDDEVFLIAFNQEVELIEDYTNDVDLINDDLNNIVVMGGTALWDAIHLGVQKAQTGSRPKKAIIVITDGEDKDSYYKLDEMVAKVQESDVQVYGIGFLNEMPDKGLFGHWTKSEPEKAHDALLRVSEETGAKAFFPKDAGDIHNIVSQIAFELRNQYSISYVSSNAARDGAWRRIRVALDPAAAGNGLRARYRAGYFAPKPANANK
jgi:Ca-activated chloride channel family protein